MDVLPLPYVAYATDLLFYVGVVFYFNKHPCPIFLPDVQGKSKASQKTPCGHWP